MRRFYGFVHEWVYQWAANVQMKNIERENVDSNTINEQ